MCMKGPKAPPPPPPPPAPPQESKAPDVEVIKEKNKKKAGGMNAGPESTLLTGPSGLDPNSLTISKSALSSLLGS